MKKDGIQTRNRKMSTKSKKKKGMGGMDLLKPLDKTFHGFPTHNMQHHMAGGMPPYMGGGSSLGSSLGGGFMGSHGGHHPQMASPLSAGFSSGFGNTYHPASLSSSFTSQFPSIPSSIPASGLNLSTSSNMVGAMA